MVAKKYQAWVLVEVSEGPNLLGLGMVETSRQVRVLGRLVGCVVRSSFCDRKATGTSRTHACHGPPRRSRGSTASLGPRLDDKCREPNFRGGVLQALAWREEIKLKTPVGEQARARQFARREMSRICAECDDVCFGQDLQVGTTR